VFNPQISDCISINGTEYEFVKLEVATAIEMVHVQEAGKAKVYKVVSSNDRVSEYALKVFFPEYQTSHTVKSDQQLARYKNVPGLRVCDRKVIKSKDDCLQVEQYSDLLYSVLMPWISGQTWSDVVGSQFKDQNSLTFTRLQSLNLAHLTAKVLASIERHGLAHCDIASGNVIFDLKRQLVELVDVEDMYGSGFVKSKNLPLGSMGYAHKSARNGIWCAEADRFAGAVLLAEMLCWYDPQVRQLVESDTYFIDNEEGQNCPRYRALHKTLRSAFSPSLADLFKKAWFSERLEQCPKLNNWANALEELRTLREPVLQVSPLEINFGAIGRTGVSRTIRIKNIGTATLKGTISTPDTSWLTIMRNKFEVKPEKVRNIEVKAHSMEQESTSLVIGYLQINSNGGREKVIVNAKLLPAPNWRPLVGGVVGCSTLLMAFMILIISSMSPDGIGCAAFILITGFVVTFSLLATKEKTKTTGGSLHSNKNLPPPTKDSLVKETDIFLVTSDGTQTESVKTHLERQSLKVSDADGASAIDTAQNVTPKLVVISLSSIAPASNSLCQQLHDMFNVPFMLLTTDSDAEEKIVSQDIIADEYLIGSIRDNELSTRVQVLMQRKPYQPQTSSPVHIGSLTLDPTTRKAIAGAQPLNLQGLEFDLLMALVEHEGFNSYEQLYQMVWGGQVCHPQTVDIHVKRLRKRLTSLGISVASVQNAGYIIVEL